MFAEIDNKTLLQIKISNLKMFLDDYGFKTNKDQLESIFSTVILKEGRNTEEIRKNPYLLYGFFNFEAIDELAIKNNTEIKEDELRIIASIPSVLDNKITLEGHTIFQIDSVVEDIVKKLELPNEHLDEIKEVIKKYSDKNIIIKSMGNEHITSIKLFHIEEFIYNTLKNNRDIEKGAIVSENTLKEFISKEENEIGFSYAENQIKIIELANKRLNIFSLNGYAGAGKTTTAKSILNLYSKIYSRDQIVCCALSGVAANRAKLVTGYNSMTVHALLGFDGENFSKNSTNKLNYNFIMLDEAGMIDSELFYRLLQAINFETTTLMIAGDSAQLQSVGNGDVYNDILNLGLCETVTLDKVYRQKEEQVINTMAQSIRMAKTPVNFTHSGYEDFQFHIAYGQNIKESIKEIASKYVETTNELLLQKKYQEYLTEFQVVVPIKKGNLGAYSLNNILQEIFNSSSDECLIIKTKEKTTNIKVKDKVIHLKNQKMQTVTKDGYMRFEQGEKILDADIVDRKVFNGQVGIVVKIIPSGNNGKGANYVYYPDNDYVAIYTNSDILRYGLLDLAYAITVHKSQGSQYNTLLMPISSNYFNMLNNKLLYTAITRAKKMLYVVGEKDSFVKGCTNSIEIKRDTILKHL